MSESTIATVMTRTVFTASLDTPFLELVATMTDRGLNMLPVIDTTGRPVGVVSDVDALAKLEYLSVPGFRNDDSRLRTTRTRLDGVVVHV